MKRTTAFFLGLIVLAFIVSKTTSWDRVKELVTSVSGPVASSTSILLNTLTPTSTEQTFAGDRTKPYVLHLQSGDGAQALTWRLMVDKRVSGYAYTASEVYEVYGNVVPATDQLVFSADTKEGVVVAMATTTWQGSKFSAEVLKGKTTSTLRLLADAADASALVTFVEVEGSWKQEKPSMGCEFYLMLPVVQAGNGVSAAAASRINQTLREQILAPSAYVLHEMPSTATAPRTPAEAKDIFIRTCRAQLADEIRSFQGEEAIVGGMFQRSVNVSPSITHNQDGWLSFTSDAAVYSGGAHGSNLRLTYLFDTRTGARIQIQDLIRADARSVFDQRLGRELLRGYSEGLFEESAATIRTFATASPASAQTLWTRGESGLSSSTAFYLVGRGMNVVFQQYEVSPYAVGLPEVYLPYEGWQDLVISGRSPFASR